MREIRHIFWRSLAPGCTSFSGPAAHMNYFHCTFVVGLCWIAEAANVRLIALSQSLLRSALLLAYTERVCLAAFVGITLA